MLPTRALHFAQAAIETMNGATTESWLDPILCRLPTDYVGAVPASRCLIFQGLPGRDLE